MVNLTQTAIVQDIKILGMGFPCQTLANLITFFYACLVYEIPKNINKRESDNRRFQMICSEIHFY